jgi:hypothetical protein
MIANEQQNRDQDLNIEASFRGVSMNIGDEVLRIRDIAKKFGMDLRSAMERMLLTKNSGSSLWGEIFRADRNIEAEEININSGFGNGKLSSLQGSEEFRRRISDVINPLQSLMPTHEPDSQLDL